MACGWTVWYERSYGYTHLLIRHSSLNRQLWLTDIRRYEVLLPYNDLTHLNIYFPYTYRCLATVSDNSATYLTLFVISNGGQEVHARTMTSVCKIRIYKAMVDGKYIRIDSPDRIHSDKFVLANRTGSFRLGAIYYHISYCSSSISKIGIIRANTFKKGYFGAPL